MALWMRFAVGETVRSAAVLAAMATTFAAVIAGFGIAGLVATAVSGGPRGPAALAAFGAIPAAATIGALVGIAVARRMPDPRLGTLRAVAEAFGLRIVQDDARMFVAQGTHRDRAMRLEQAAWGCLFAPVTLIVACRAGGHATLAKNVALGADPAWTRALQQHPTFTALDAARPVSVTPEHVRATGALAWLASEAVLTERILALLAWVEAVERCPPPVNAGGSWATRAGARFGPRQSTSLADGLRVMRAAVWWMLAGMAGLSLVGAGVSLVVVAIG